MLGLRERVNGEKEKQKDEFKLHVNGNTDVVEALVPSACLINRRLAQPPLQRLRCERGFRRFDSLVFDP